MEIKISESTKKNHEKEQDLVFAIEGIMDDI